MFQSRSKIIILLFVLSIQSLFVCKVNGAFSAATEQTIVNKILSGYQTSRRADVK